MKTRLIPVYFKSSKQGDFSKQINFIKDKLKNEVEILDSVPLGSSLKNADAVLFPELLGDVYSHVKEIRKIKLPLLIITSEFGTISMWDWEIIEFLKSEGIETIAPYNIAYTKLVCQTLRLKREMRNLKFLIFQDNPGEGMQASIFKRFYWWDEKCIHTINQKFGITIEKRSFQKLGEEVKNISNSHASEVIKKWNIKTDNISEKSILSAIKLYIALNNYAEKDPGIKGMGINCLNESFFSDSTPCLAWNLLFKDKGIIWACEADIMTLLTTLILQNSMNAEIIHTNIYPFLLGNAALKHEKIKKFPDIKEPENHMLLAHCGYFGVVPDTYAEEWTLRPSVLEIVNKNSIVIDAKLAKGPITLAKLDPTCKKILVAEGNLIKYIQYPGSDCGNSAIVKISDGDMLMNKVYSHHNCLITGHKLTEISYLAKVLDIAIDKV